MSPDEAGPAVRVEHLTQRFGAVTALDDVTLTLSPGSVHGLLGRNGAGKTTLMRILAGHLPARAGRVEVFGRPPFENADVLSRVCLIREGQSYPEGYHVRHVLRAAASALPRWDAGYADRLTDAFELPARRPVKKLSRGMLSALGVVVGLASRAPLTLFDEPYLGLDAVSRQVFYDHLLADVAKHPRTVMVSTHLIDEIADLLEYVVVLDRGRVLLAAEADALRQDAVMVTGPAAEVDRVVSASGAVVLSTERLGGTTRACLRPAAAVVRPAAAAGLTVEPVPLQRLVVELTDRAGGPAPIDLTPPSAAARPAPSEEVVR
jgi:ABC-2 type transport system ATP-binding protein